MRSVPVRSRFFVGGAGGTAKFDDRERRARGGTAGSPGRRRTAAGPRQPTHFERCVYVAVLHVPRGKVTTYGAIAALLRTHPRAVGNALRLNPFAPRVPCHRVVSASRSLGGYGGQTQARALNLSRKKHLLKSEGVIFEVGTDRVASESILNVSTSTVIQDAIQHATSEFNRCVEELGASCDSGSGPSQVQLFRPAQPDLGAPPPSREPKLSDSPPNAGSRLAVAQSLLEDAELLSPGP
mmetsp:Transcript_10285/g.26105  ORF Transcript_10285/g.26105 Transcript_10285/m.26105 type:complete len:239 (-) Transcript_10285:50-766(-)